MYTGEFVNGKIHGKGSVEDFLTSTSYTGELADGNITGVGKYQFSDGSEYEGGVLNGKFHGDVQFTLYISVI